MDYSNSNFPRPHEQEDLTWSMCGEDPLLKSYIASEDHLQVLGLTVDNGKPQFKLNEPCESLAASTICAKKAAEGYNSSQSFVVLSHSSLEAIQTETLANYEKIQEKTASIDYNSIISNMSPTDIEHKLSDMLHENLMLKETLAENTEALKKQFNSLAVFQDEVSTIHQNHKQKFAQTRDLINQLKKENMELKMQIASEQCKSIASQHTKKTESQSLQTSISNICNCSSREEEFLTTVEQLRMESEKYKAECEKLSRELQRTKDVCDNLRWELRTSKSHENELMELTESNENYRKELDECREHYNRLSEEVDKYLSLSNLMRLELKINSARSKTLDLMPGMDKSSNSNDPIAYFSPARTDDSQNVIEGCSEKEMKSSFLKEFVAAMDNIVSFTNNIVPIEASEIQKDIESQISPSEARQQLIQDVKSYSEKMKVLADCFSAQSSRYSRIQECLKECTSILHHFETFSEKETKTLDNSTLETYRNTLSECRKKLVNEQLENIVERQKWTKVHNQLQKIFSDYKSALCELQITQEENKLLATIYDNNTEERLQKAKDLEKLLAEEKIAFEEAKKILALEKLRLSNERKTVDELRESAVAAERNYSVNLEKLEQERLSLIEEKSALDRQSKLYEAQENSLLMEKKLLMKMCEDSNEKVLSLEQRLQQQIELAEVDKENLMVLRAQVEIFRSDYQLEKESKKEILRDKNKLVEHIQKLTEENEELRKNVDRLRKEFQRLQVDPASNSTPGPISMAFENASTSGMTQLYSCPICGIKFSSLDPLVDHVDECMQRVECQ